MMRLHERVQFHVKLPYPIERVIEDENGKLEITRSPSDVMLRLSLLLNKLPIAEVRVTMATVTLAIVVQSFEEKSGPEQLAEIERVLVAEGFAPRSMWL